MLPEDVSVFLYHGFLQVDTETDGLDFRRDKLRLVTIANTLGDVVLIRNPNHRSNNLKAVLENANLIFHHAAFDLRFLYWWCGIKPHPNAVRCTKVLSKMARPSNSSSLYKVVPEVLGVDAFKDKTVTLSDWNVKKLSAEQITYACTDVVHLLDLDLTMHKILTKGMKQTFRTACEAATLAAFVEVEGHVDTLSYEGQPNPKLGQLWEKRKKEMRS